MNFSITVIVCHASCLLELLKLFKVSAFRVKKELGIRQLNKLSILALDD